MQELEKILEEIEKQKSCCLMIGYAKEYNQGALKMAEVIEDIIRKHMDNNNLCEKCSRRKWYQIGYKDGKNDGWIPVEERLPERTPDEKINNSYQKYLVFIDNIDYWDIDIAVYDLWNDKKWREFSNTYCEIENVTAWCPLPDPYKKIQEENK